jgi:cation-transporting P-type ATPase I
VVVTAVGSLAALAAIVSTPGLSQLLGNTPLGPVGWVQALGSAIAATLAAAAISRLLGQRLAYAASDEAASEESSISTIPARQSTAYSSRNGMVSTRATTTVNGSELKPINNFDTVPTVAET